MNTTIKNFNEELRPYNEFELMLAETGLTKIKLARRLGLGASTVYNFKTVPLYVKAYLELLHAYNGLQAAHRNLTADFEDYRNRKEYGRYF